MARTFVVINKDGQTIRSFKTRRKALCKAMKDINGGAIHRGVVEVKTVQTHNLKPIGARRPGTKGTLSSIIGRFGMRELPLPQPRVSLVRGYGSVDYSIFRSTVAA